VTTVSAKLATRDRCKAVLQTLDHLAQLDLHEVVVVVDGSHDGTLQALLLA